MTFVKSGGEFILDLLALAGTDQTLLRANGPRIVVIRLATRQPRLGSELEIGRSKTVITKI